MTQQLSEARETRQLGHRLAVQLAALQVEPLQPLKTVRWAAESTKICRVPAALVAPQFAQRGQLFDDGQLLQREVEHALEVSQLRQLQQSVEGQRADGLVGIVILCVAAE